MQPNRKKFYDTGVNEMKYSDYISDEKIMKPYIFYMTGGGRNV